MRLVLINNLVLGLRRTQLVEVDGVELVLGGHLVARFRRRVTAVEESVLVPGKARHLDPFQRVGQHFARGDFHDVGFAPIGAALRNAVGQVFAVTRNGGSG